MGLEGKYEFVKEEGFRDHFKALLGDKVPPPQGSGPKKDTTVEIAIDGNKVTVTSGDSPARNYVLNQTVDEKFFGDHLIKVSAKLEGDVLTLETAGGDKLPSNKRVYALSGSELVLTLSAPGKPDVPDGKKYYKKL